ncbi:MAG: glycosyltransferase [Vallitaleaceae bacterium]|nr:glycosyltransferase [Vallitaleaceae bacterium]
MIKLIIINHTFQKPEFYKRWKCLTQKYNDVDITLLAPMEWKWGEEKTLTYGQTERLQGIVVDDKRFRIHLIDTKKDIMGEWRSIKLEEEVLNARPDLVYFIGGHTAQPLMQILRLRKKHNLNNMKVVAFSMRGCTPTIDFKKSEPGIKKYIKYVGKCLILGPRLRNFNKHCDAVFCHYPDALKRFRLDGYDGPIYMQTQVGVDPDIFYPNSEAREKIRNKFNIGDAYLFGSASRFHYSKGLSEIIRALPKDGNWKFLMMGWGRPDEVEKINNEIAERRLENKIILTGYIDNWTDMAEHWNALDCAVHTPLTTSKWEETFSLALVQEMITGLPVIGSSSGSVPYQIGPDGIIVQEGDVQELNNAMVKMMTNPELGKEIGEKLKNRTLSNFSIYRLNELFYLTIQDILNDVYDEKKIDMVEFKDYEI